MKIVIEANSVEELEELFRQWKTGKGHEEPITEASVPAPVIPDLANTQESSAPIKTPAPGIPTQTAIPVAPNAQTVPTSMAAYQLDDLARAGVMLMNSGKQAQLQQLLADFGVQSLPELPEAQYGAFATALRGMGAQI